MVSEEFENEITDADIDYDGEDEPDFSKCPVCNSDTIIDGLCMECFNEC